MRHLHTPKTVWLCRCLTLLLLLSVTMAGATGWAKALYLFSDGEQSAALDDSHSGIESLLLNLDTGKSGENAVLTEGTMVTVRRGGETITATARKETVKQFLSRMDIIPGSREMVGIELMENSVMLTISDHLTVFERVTEKAEHETVYRDTPDLPKGEERVARKGMDGQHTAIYEQTWVSGELVTSQYVEEISTTSVTEVVERGTAVSYVEPDDKLVNVTTQSDGSGYLTFASGGTMKFSKAVTVTATAYTAGYDKGGKVITKNVLGKTQAEVKEKLKTAIEESQKLDPTRTGQYTVQTWVTLWYEVFIKPQIRPNTKQFYRNCMENHLFPALGDCPLEKLSTIQIQRAINEMSEHGRNHYYSHIPLKETTLRSRRPSGS